MVDISVLTMVYEPTYNWGAPSCAQWFVILGDFGPLLQLNWPKIVATHPGDALKTTRTRACLGAPWVLLLLAGKNVELHQVMGGFIMVHLPLKHIN